MTIPDHYPIEKDVLFGGEYPGAPDPKIARDRISALVDKGIRTFIDLTTSHDHLAPYEPFLDAIAEATGLQLRRIHLPVPDMGVPSEETMRSILMAIRESIAEHPAVYVHCWGGIGRTGTVAGCWFRECGNDANSALALVQHHYSSHMEKAKNGNDPHAPQTRAQVDFIKTWRPA